MRFSYRNGEEANHLAILESLGGGCGVLDYDGDGLVDLLFAGGGWFEEQTVRGHPLKLFRNRGNWQFEDATAATGLADALRYSHGIAVGDYDRDGWPDVAVTGWGPLALYHNVPGEQGGRTFEACGTQAGFVEHLWSSSAAWGDLDGDGWPDLYVCQYGDWSFEKNHPTDCYYAPPKRDVCPPRRFKPLPHKIYRNQRDGTFADVSQSLGLRTDGRGLGVIIADINADARPDIYVANDTDENFLYVNRSAPDQFRLEEAGLIAGVARDDRGTPNGSMGVDVVDFNRSGRASIFCTNYESELNALYRNDCRDGRELFQFCSQQTGIAAIGQTWVSWGTAFADFRHCGWEDLFIANGHAIRYPAGKTPRQQRPVLFRNDQGRFLEVGRDCGPYFRGVHNARGVALADLDNDGAVDLIVCHLNEPVALLRNLVGPALPWLGLSLRARDGRSTCGATVTLHRGQETQTRFVKGGGSYASSSDRRIVFGLGDHPTIDKVVVAWPWGSQETFTGLTANRYWRITEGQGAEPDANPAPATAER
ncbi:MAG: CRTAC1 family protein [Pirellulales bacterium]